MFQAADRFFKLDLPMIKTKIYFIGYQILETYYSSIISARIPDMVDQSQSTVIYGPDRNLSVNIASPFYSESQLRQETGDNLTTISSEFSRGDKEYTFVASQR